MMMAGKLYFGGMALYVVFVVVMCLVSTNFRGGYTDSFRSHPSRFVSTLAQIIGLVLWPLMALTLVSLFVQHMRDHVANTPRVNGATTSGSFPAFESTTATRKMRPREDSRPS